MEEISFSRDEALARGLLRHGARTRIASSVRIVPLEDDGSDYGPVEIGEDCIIRDNVVLSTGCRLGNHVLIGHQCALRRNVRIGNNSTLSHIVSVQHDVVIGNWCRVSSHSHLTGGTIIEDQVQIGAGVTTVDDNVLEWPTKQLRASVFREGCRVGSGCTILGGIEIGMNTLIGAGSLVTRSIPPGVIAYGSPAYVQRDRPPRPVRNDEAKAS
jgi:acetyltransferase-like isoleucine patch superfamily enzyme